LGRYRWVVERTLAWLHQFRRLRIRYERRSDIHEAFMSLACALICWRFL
jgi:transposase